MTLYDINPCEACYQKYKNTDCNINDLNNCCYETLAAFANVSSVNSIRNSQQAKNCVECLKQRMKSMGPFGRTFCDLRLQPAPIIENAPHYFPYFLNENNTPDKAYELCINKCKNSKYPYECLENCKTDRNAIVYKENFEYSQNNKYIISFFTISFLLLLIVSIYKFKNYK